MFITQLSKSQYDALVSAFEAWHAGTRQQAKYNMSYNHNGARYTDYRTQAAFKGFSVGFLHKIDQWGGIEAPTVRQSLLRLSATNELEEIHNSFEATKNQWSIGKAPIARKNDNMGYTANRTNWQFLAFVAGYQHKGVNHG